MSADEEERAAGGEISAVAGVCCLEDGEPDRLARNSDRPAAGVGIIGAVRALCSVLLRSGAVLEFHAGWAARILK